MTLTGWTRPQWSVITAIVRDQSPDSNPLVRVIHSDLIRSLDNRNYFSPGNDML